MNKKKFNPILSYYNKLHLCGWGMINNELEKIQTCDDSINIITFLSQSFTQYKNKSYFEKLFKNDWIGIDHLTNYVPEYYRTINQCNSYAFFEKAYKMNLLGLCRGILFTSEFQLKIQANNPILDSIKKDFIYHPIVQNEKSVLFDYEKFLKNKNKKLINLGWYNRNFAAFEKLNSLNYKKLFVFGGKDDYRFKIFKEDMNYHNIENATTEISPNLSDEELNNLLSDNVVFLNLYDSSANNAVLDCIERNTPIIVNRLPACEEYLGKGYPLFYDSIKEVPELLDTKSIGSANEYLLKLDKTKFSMKIFVEKINSFVSDL